MWSFASLSCAFFSFLGYAAGAAMELFVTHDFFFFGVVALGQFQVRGLLQFLLEAVA